MTEIPLTLLTDVVVAGERVYSRIRRAMRNRLALTIFVGVAAVLVAIAGLAAESSWPILAAAVVVLLTATALVVGATLASMDDSEDQT